MGSCMFLLYIMPFPALSDMRIIFVIILFLQMFFDFVVFIVYVAKRNEAKDKEERDKHQ